MGQVSFCPPSSRLLFRKQTLSVPLDPDLGLQTMGRMLSKCTVQVSSSAQDLGRMPIAHHTYHKSDCQNLSLTWSLDTMLGNCRDIYLVNQ